MSNSLRVLLIEDSDDDALLLLRELRRGGWQPVWERVDTAAALIDALPRQPWDLITCDYVMPRFGALAALEIVRQHGVDVPVIVVSGEIGEETAVTTMKAGAHDFVSKHRLTRLVPAIERELRDAAIRREHKRTERSFAQTKERFWSYIEQATDLIFTLGLDGRVTSVNRRACEVTGYTTDELLGKPALELIVPESRAAMQAALQQVLTGGSIEQAEAEILSKDERRIFLEIRGRTIRDAGHIVETFHIARDITERKLAETERARLSAAVEQTAEAIMITDPTGTVLYVNSACERMTGYSRAELCGQTARTLLSPQRSAEDYRDMDATLMRGEIWRGVDLQQHKAGELYEIDLVASPVYDAGGQLISYVGVARDVTYDRRVEAQLRQAQKLEAVARLAGGVAHDFNNQLTVIKGCLQLLLAKLPPGDPGRRDAERINATVDKSAQLVRQLLTFSRRQPVELRRLNLTVVANEMTPMLRLLAGEQVILRVHTAPQLSSIIADRGQIEQVITNLVANACDALVPDQAKEATPGGTICIETENVELTVPVQHAAGGSLAPGAYVLLTVSDNGPGIPYHTQERIFEPFFTTKDVSKGSGLGLATTLGIVEQHHGAIVCTSQPDRGTAFRVYFPRAHADVDPAPTPAAARTATARGPQEAIVLLVEDEERVREMLITFLQESGYQVHGAADATEALAVAAQLGGTIDLLLSDVVLPGVSGLVLARRLVALHPGIRVVLMSGYLSDTLDLAEVPGARFLAKPFDLDELLRTLSELLAR